MDAHDKIKCQKCGYDRTERDDNFFKKEECPKCGIIYAKITAYPTSQGSPGQENQAQGDGVKQEISMDNETKKCPFCAETIKLEATKCRYCHSDIRPAVVAEDTTLKHKQFEQKIIDTGETSSRTEAVQSAGSINESKAFLGGVHHPWRRYFARTVDMYTGGILGLIIFSIIVGLLLPDQMKSFEKALYNQYIAYIILLVLWMPIETVLLSTVGTTPGKWLFGISVRTSSGQKPSFNQALKRSFRVVLQGMSLLIITLLFAYRRLTKTGTTLWDAATDCVVTHKTWSTARAIVCTTVVVLLYIMLAIVNTALK